MDPATEDVTTLTNVSHPIDDVLNEIDSAVSLQVVVSLHKSKAMLPLRGVKLSKLHCILSPQIKDRPEDWRAVKAVANVL